MWLLGSTTQADLQGIADYFQNPMKIASSGGSGAGDATSVIPGGGQDLTRQAGQVKKGDIKRRETTFSKEAEMERKRQERQQLEELKGRIEQMIVASPELSQFKNQLLLDITSEGLRLQIVDEQNRPMFDLSSAELKPYTKQILREIGVALNTVDNKVSVTGHTDASQYSSGEKSFSNWELSSNRANASRRELLEGGMNPEKLMRVVGLSSTVLFNKENPLDPINRRISIVVLNKKTEETIRNDESAVPKVEDLSEEVTQEKITDETQNIQFKELPQLEEIVPKLVQPLPVPKPTN